MSRALLNSNYFLRGLLVSSIQCLRRPTAQTRSLRSNDRRRKRREGCRNQIRWSDSPLQRHGYDLRGFRWGILYPWTLVLFVIVTRNTLGISFYYYFSGHAFIFFLFSIQIRYQNNFFYPPFFCCCCYSLSFVIARFASLTSFDANGPQKNRIEISNVFHISHRFHSKQADPVLLFINGLIIVCSYSLAFII